MIKDYVFTKSTKRILKYFSFKVFNYLSQISDYKRERFIRTLKENVKAYSVVNYYRKYKKLINKKNDVLA